MVKDCYQATSILMEDVFGEVRWVKIETDYNPLYVGSFYCTPSDKSTYQLDKLEKSLHNIKLISRNNPNATIVVAGDFNLGDVDWDSGIVPPGARDRSNREKLLDILCSNNLEQQNMSLGYGYTGYKNGWMDACLVLDCFTLLLARHLADVSCYIAPSMPSGICMEIHIKIVQKGKKKQSRDGEILGNPTSIYRLTNHIGV